MSIQIALVTPPTLSHRTAEETLALGYLATILRRAGYTVRIVDCWLEGLTTNQATKRILENGTPDLLGMSCYRSNLEQAAAVLAAIRKNADSVRAFCGGYGPTFQPEPFLASGFDAVVIGEAENIVIPLVEALRSRTELSRIPGIAYVENGAVIKIPAMAPILDLDCIPFPARDVTRSAMNQHNYVHVCTSRGCMAACSFCSVFAFALIGAKQQPRWRGRSASNIVDEIEMLYDQHGATHFKFVDDSFIEPPRSEKWVEQLADELARRKLTIRFRTQVRADRLTPRIVSALKEAGWFSTSVGVENGSPTALKRMRKVASYADNVKALWLLQQSGIYVQMGMILFDPHTTMNELWENLAFLTEHTWPVNKGIFTEMYAAEGTPFTKTAKRRGLLSAQAETQNYEYGVQDPQARRAYAMLKAWHRSHSAVYDWVIDPLTAPKVLPEDGHREAYALSRKLRELDLRFFERALQHVSSISNASTDNDLVSKAILEDAATYLAIEKRIGQLYVRHGLRYEAVPNPFLGLE